MVGGWNEWIDGDGVSWQDFESDADLIKRIEHGHKFVLSEKVTCVISVYCSGLLNYSTLLKYWAPLIPLIHL